MNRRPSKDLLAGLLFAGFGLATLWLAQGYRFGSGERMGPGFLPTVLGGLLVVLGACVMVRGWLTERERVTPFAWRPLCAVLGGFLLFGVLIPRLGLALATVVAVVVARLGARPFRALESLLLAATLAVLTSLIFVTGLGLPIPVLPR